MPGRELIPVSFQEVFLSPHLHLEALSALPLWEDPCGPFESGSTPSFGKGPKLQGHNSQGGWQRLASGYPLTIDNTWR